MRTQIVNKLIFTICIISLIFYLSCNKDEIQIKRFPRTSEEIEESYEKTLQIVKESRITIEDAINNAVINDEAVDPTLIAERINLIDGVISASPTSTGSAIILELEDSTFANILLFGEDDQRMFIENTKNIDIDGGDIKSGNEDFLIPTGSGKALILAPFQRVFQTDLGTIIHLFKLAGYSPIDTFLNSHVTLEKLEGNYLNDYDIVFIRTHGVADGYTWNGYLSTFLFTGEEFDGFKIQEKYPDAYHYIANYYWSWPPDEDKAYYAVSASWIKITTTDGNFLNSWIYAGGCETAIYDNGPKSMSEAFLSKGAAGYNGFNGKIITELSNSVALKMTENFTSGLSFKEASDAVRKEQVVGWLTRLVKPTKSDVSLFDNNQLSELPFYLIDPTISYGIIFNPNLSYGSVEDLEDNVYKTIDIGDQTWMAQNLRATRYNNGTSISLVADANDWNNIISTPAYCWYNNDDNDKEIYGALYNWYTVRGG